MHEYSVDIDSAPWLSGAVRKLVGVLPAQLASMATMLKKQTRPPIDCIEAYRLHVQNSNVTGARCVNASTRARSCGRKMPNTFVSLDGLQKVLFNEQTNRVFVSNCHETRQLRVPGGIGVVP